MAAIVGAMIAMIVLSLGFNFIRVASTLVGLILVLERS